jgi:CRP-like cAMP-binding protein
MAWSSLFAATNALKIARILDERKGNVVLTEHEEDIYEEHFLSHGLTPKQFAKLLSCAEVIDAKKGEQIVRAGEKIDKVYLVVQGQTRASFLGRRVSAASSAPGNQVALRGGDAGAWIGETAFLDWFWNREKNIKKKTSAGDKKDGVHDEEEFDDDEEDVVPPESTTGLAIHTIVANTDDCELLCWKHSDLEALMHKSADLRSALTRSMTAAIVGKVINLTVSRSERTLPTWSTWLDDWKQGDKTRVNVVQESSAFTAERQETIAPVKTANKVIKKNTTERHCGRSQHFFYVQFVLLGVTVVRLSLWPHSPFISEQEVVLRVATSE